MKDSETFGRLAYPQFTLFFVVKKYLRQPENRAILFLSCSVMRGTAPTAPLKKDPLQDQVTVSSITRSAMPE